ncbi:MAG: hypothetical protein P8171_11910 [Candidatus Thiodiazotropha sp.]
MYFSDEAKIVTTATGAGLLPMCQTLIDTNYHELAAIHAFYLALMNGGVAHPECALATRRVDGYFWRILIPVYCLDVQG